MILAHPLFLDFFAGLGLVSIFALIRTLYSGNSIEPVTLTVHLALIVFFALRTGFRLSAFLKARRLRRMPD